MKFDYQTGGGHPRNQVSDAGVSVLVFVFLPMARENSSPPVGPVQSGLHPVSTRLAQLVCFSGLLGEQFVFFFPLWLLHLFGAFV